jgi:hypothetical protein
MTDSEFDVMDELYFVQSFNALVRSLSLPEDELQQILDTLIRKGWVKLLRTVDEELPIEEANFATQYKSYFYLATKEGLFAHNSR